MYGFARRTTESGLRFDAAGGFVQVGQLFRDRRLEAAFRYGRFDPADLAGRDLTREIRGVFSYYYARHNLKWQNDLGRVDVQNGDAASTRVWEFRSQLQFAF
jgi:hypothetical protein